MGFCKYNEALVIDSDKQEKGLARRQNHLWMVVKKWAKVLYIAQNIPFYTNFLKCFRGSMSLDPPNLALYLWHCPSCLNCAVSLIFFQRLNISVAVLRYVGLLTTFKYVYPRERKKKKKAKVRHEISCLMLSTLDKIFSRQHFKYFS